MKTFKEYLAEAVKTYQARIKIAGELPENFETKLKNYMTKYETIEFKKTASTPVQEHPHEFTRLKNVEVTIFDVTTNYPASPREMKEYLATYMNLPQTHMVVRKPNEPTEEYQEQMQVAKNSEYKNKLLDIEMTDSPKVKPEDYHSTQANMSLLKELLKDRESKYEVEKGTDNKVQDTQSKEEKGSPSPIKGHDGPIKGNPRHGRGK